MSESLNKDSAKFKKIQRETIEDVQFLNAGCRNSTVVSNNRDKYNDNYPHCLNRAIKQRCECDMECVKTYLDKRGLDKTCRYWRFNEDKLENFYIYCPLEQELNEVYNFVNKRDYDVELYLMRKIEGHAAAYNSICNNGKDNSWYKSGIEFDKYRCAKSLATAYCKGDNRCYQKFDNEEPLNSWCMDHKYHKVFKTNNHVILISEHLDDPKYNSPPLKPYFIPRPDLPHTTLNYDPRTRPPTRKPTYDVNRDKWPIPEVNTTTIRPHYNPTDTNKERPRTRPPIIPTDVDTNTNKDSPFIPNKTPTDKEDKPKQPHEEDVSRNNDIPIFTNNNIPTSTVEPHKPVTPVPKIPVNTNNESPKDPIRPITRQPIYPNRNDIRPSSTETPQSTTPVIYNYFPNNNNNTTLTYNPITENPKGPSLGGDDTSKTKIPVTELYPNITDFNYPRRSRPQHGVNTINKTETDIYKKKNITLVNVSKTNQSFPNINTTVLPEITTVNPKNIPNTSSVDFFNNTNTTFDNKVGKQIILSETALFIAMLALILMHLGSTFGLYNSRYKSRKFIFFILISLCAISCLLGIEFMLFLP